jgi:hypothetical protein
MASSVIIPPSFHYSVVLPACYDAPTTERFYQHYMYLQWCIRFLFNELRFKDGVLHSPERYRFFQGELMEIERYMQELDEKLASFQPEQ